MEHPLTSWRYSSGGRGGAATGRANQNRRLPGVNFHFHILENRAVSR